MREAKKKSSSQSSIAGQAWDNDKHASLKAKLVRNYEQGVDCRATSADMISVTMSTSSASVK